MNQEELLSLLTFSQIPRVNTSHFRELLTVFASCSEVLRPEGLSTLRKAGKAGERLAEEITEVQRAYNPEKDLQDLFLH